LEIKDKSMVSLEEEWSFTEMYMFLLKTRFENALHFEVKNFDDLKNWGIVPLCIQMLFENAIKHNVVSISDPLIVNIELMDGYIQVSNEIKKRLDDAKSMGTGLENIRNRCNLILGKQIEIQSNEKEFAVRIPIVEIVAHESIDH
ncbi:MAG: histidine kinase, partial [Flavobacteriales bacterium]|nr:histidine kinase [Flavobacteriales bacterium]